MTHCQLCCVICGLKAAIALNFPLSHSHCAKRLATKIPFFRIREKKEKQTLIPLVWVSTKPMKGHVFVFLWRDCTADQHLSLFGGGHATDLPTSDRQNRELVSDKLQSLKVDIVSLLFGTTKADLASRLTRSS